MRESQKLFPDSFCILFYMRDFVPLFYGIRRLLPAGHTEGILTAFPVSKAVVTWTDQPISTDGVQVSAIIACQCMSRKRLTCRLQGIRAEMRLRLREKGRRFGACHFPKIRNAHKKSGYVRGRSPVLPVVAGLNAASGLTPAVIRFLLICVTVGRRDAARRRLCVLVPRRFLPFTGPCKTSSNWSGRPNLAL